MRARTSAHASITHKQNSIAISAQELRFFALCAATDTMSSLPALADGGVGDSDDEYAGLGLDDVTRANLKVLDATDLDKIASGGATGSASDDDSPSARGDTTSSSGGDGAAMGRGKGDSSEDTKGTKGKDIG
eukprot:12741927-Alexandrium_andersonii.AAC.2